MQVSVVSAISPLLAFCLVSSAAYVVNDLRDIEQDRVHKNKKMRPLASGEISPSSAYLIATVLLLAGLLFAAQVSPVFIALILAYVAVNLLYSLRLKNLPLLDLFCISAGFLLRLQAGGEAFGTAISAWLFLSVFFLALFLSIGKRLCEKIVLADNALEHRPVLECYPEGFLDGIMYMVGAAALVTYTMYVVARPALIYTVPLCCFGLMRYILRVKSGKGGDPTQSLLRDPALFCTGFVWAVMVGWSIYQ
ncbi:decaprenyl-phosphate phosphoribosyltransferase [Geopsychrobacter electrodiphilus]|uniref:decaprenyl-phosphate phosphoribosyltransferase n=1 Tax=Geopsychrobacter electrodiphilus TaxID=225196 RepID=UPI00035DCE21|nr:decaprenyl-phosphate phosphoribosyltransferase [Geopsychrobacter electrodiphilus]